MLVWVCFVKVVGVAILANTKADTCIHFLHTVVPFTILLNSKDCQNGKLIGLHLTQMQNDVSQVSIRSIGLVCLQ